MSAAPIGPAVYCQCSTLTQGWVKYVPAKVSCMTRETGSSAGMAASLAYTRCAGKVLYGPRYEPVQARETEKSLRVVSEAILVT